MKTDEKILRFKMDENLPATTILKAKESATPPTRQAVGSENIQESLCPNVTRKKSGSFSPRIRSQRARFVRNLGRGEEVNYN